MKNKTFSFLAILLISTGVMAQEKSVNTAETLKSMANAISRMDATQSILSVVVPRCQESNLRNFYTDFGNYFLDKYPPVMGKGLSPLLMVINMLESGMVVSVRDVGLTLLLMVQNTLVSIETISVTVKAYFMLQMVQSLSKEFGPKTY